MISRGITFMEVNCKKACLEGENHFDTDYAPPGREASQHKELSAGPFSWSSCSMGTIHYTPSVRTLGMRALEIGPMKSSAVRVEVVWLHSQ